MVSLTFLVAVGVGEPVLGLTRLLIEDRLFSCPFSWKRMVFLL